jgi:ribosomal-protein-alanine N-acetyltransferase
VSAASAVFLAAAAEDDAPVLAAFAARCASHPWSESAFRGALRGGAGERVAVLRDAGRVPVGFCVWQEVADEAHVHNVAVDPERRRTGLGRRLVRVCLGLATSRGARRAFLDVRVGNVAARGLYGCLGFRETGRRASYYAEPTEDALLMEADLPLAAEP